MIAAEIRGVQITMADLVERIRVEQGINRYQGGFVDLSTRPFEILQTMLYAEILRQEAPKLGISISDEQINETIRELFSPRAVPGQETDANQLLEEFQNAYGIFLTQTRLTDQDFRVIMEENLRRRELSRFLDRSIPESLEQVEVAWIRFDPQSSIIPDEVAQRLKDGEDFAAVAKDVRTPGAPDPFVDPETGYVGWVPEGAFPELDRKIFGEFSDPVLTQDGIYIIHKLAGPEERELDPQMRSKLNLLGASIPESVEQVEVEWIRLEAESDIRPQEVIQRLENGEDFAVVAAEVGTPAGYADPDTGYVGWVPEGAFPDLDETIFGRISDPVFTQDGTYIIHKLAGPEERELEALMRSKLNTELVNKWEVDQLSKGTSEEWVKIQLDSKRYAWIAEQVRLSAPRTGDSQPPRQPGQ